MPSGPAAGSPRAEWPSSPSIEHREIALHARRGWPGQRPPFVASPQDCGLAGGEYFPFTFGPELPGDQRDDDARSLCFDLDVPAGPLDIVGAPSVRLAVASDRPQANAVVRLCDVHPDGASELIAWGVLNLTHRASHELPQPLTPGETVEVTVVLDQCAYRVPAGHRLRVAVSTAYWPMIWPSPEPVALTLSAATLSLPVRPRPRGDEWTFPQPEAAAPWRTETLRNSSSRRTVERDQATGVVTQTIADDFGEVCATSITASSNGSAGPRGLWTIHPDDPLSASRQLPGLRPARAMPGRCAQRRRRRCGRTGRASTCAAASAPTREKS